MPEADSASPDPHADAWAATLFELETELAQIRATGSPRASTWQHPKGIGALPAEYAERARTILDDQRRELTHLRQERASVARHLAALESIPPRRGVRTPVYLDTSG